MSSEQLYNSGKIAMMMMVFEKNNHTSASESYCENHLDSYTWKALCNACVIVSKRRVIYDTSVSMIL